MNGNDTDWSKSFSHIEHRIGAAAEICPCGSLLNIYFRLSGFQSSLLLIYVRFGYTEPKSEKKLSGISLSTFKIDAAQLRSVTEIIPKSPFSCVNRAEALSNPVSFSSRRRSYPI